MTDTTTDKRKQPRVTCPHCKAKRAHEYQNHTYPNGNRAMRCAACGRQFIDRICARTSNPDRGNTPAAPLLDPTDPTGQTEIARNQDEIELMLEAAEINPALPRALYLLRSRNGKKGKSIRTVAREMKMPHTTLQYWLDKVKTMDRSKEYTANAPVRAHHRDKRHEAESMCATGDAV